MKRGNRWRRGRPTQSALPWRHCLRLDCQGKGHQEMVGHCPSEVWPCKTQFKCLGWGVHQNPSRTINWHLSRIQLLGGAVSYLDCHREQKIQGDVIGRDWRSRTAVNEGRLGVIHGPNLHIMWSSSMPGLKLAQTFETNLRERA